MPLGTTAFEPTSAWDCTTAPWSTTEPFPTNAWSSMTQPSRWTMWPMNQTSPTCVGNSRVVWMTEPSWIEVRAPIVMGASSLGSPAG